MEELISTELKQDKNEEKDAASLPVIEEMMKASLFLGHRKSKTHPRMKQHIFTTRNGMEIIDLSKTLKGLNEALDFIKSKIAAGGKILLVGTTPASKTIVEETAKRLNMPYVIERWLGGTLTNFKTLSKRISYFKKMRADRAAGKFDKYTKKERLDIDREINKLTIKFSGTENMEGMPEVMFVLDVPSHLTAIREGRIMGIPVVALVNTDVNPETVDFPIPANDRGKMGIDWILSKLEAVVEEAKKMAQSSAPKSEKA